MNLSLHASLLLAILAPAGMLTAQNIPELRVEASDRIEFLAPPGTAWALEGQSPRKGGWREVAGPFFGSGQQVVHHLAKSGPPSSNYRLKQLDPATTGSAPAKIESTTFIMRQGCLDTEYVFLSGNQGFVRTDPNHARTFVFTFTKTGPHTGEVNVTMKDGSTTRLALDFSNAGVGTWRSTITSGAAAGTRLNGIFACRAGRLNMEPLAAALPAGLTGTSVMFNEGGIPMRADFADGERGSFVLPDGSVRAFTYSYDPVDRRNAGLQIIMGDTTMDYTLDLTTVASGGFTKDVSVNGVPVGSDIPGDFTAPSAPQPSPDPDCPPEDLAGRTVRISGSKVLVLRFNADGTGQQECPANGSVQVIPFKYDYSKSGSRGSEIAVTYPGSEEDRVDTYHMDFDEECEGTYTRRDYSGGESAAASTGTFTGT